MGPFNFGTPFNISFLSIFFVKNSGFQGGNSWVYNVSIWVFDWCSFWPCWRSSHLGLYLKINILIYLLSFRLGNDNDRGSVFNYFSKLWSWTRPIHGTHMQWYIIVMCWGIPRSEFLHFFLLIEMTIEGLKRIHAFFIRINSIRISRLKSLENVRIS